MINPVPRNRASTSPPENSIHVEGTLNYYFVPEADQVFNTFRGRFCRRHLTPRGYASFIYYPHCNGPILRYHSELSSPALTPEKVLAPAPRGLGAKPVPFAPHYAVTRAGEVYRIAPAPGTRNPGPFARRVRRLALSYFSPYTEGYSLRVATPDGGSKQLRVTLRKLLWDVWGVDVPRNKQPKPKTQTQP